MVIGLDELESKIDSFYVISCISAKTISNDGWYVDIRAPRNMTSDRNIFNKFWEQEGGIWVDLNDDYMNYHVKELGSIYF